MSEQLGRLKSQEELEAQIADFAFENREQMGVQRLLMQNIARLATVGEVGICHQIVQQDEYYKVTNAQELVSPEQYTHHLKEKGGRQNENIKARAEFLQQFDSFSPYINDLRQSLDEFPLNRRHPSFLGSGKDSHGFLLSVDMNEYVARLPKESAIPTSAKIDEYVVPAIRAKGIPRLERMVAASYEEGVTIAERIPGKPNNELTVDDIKGIDRQHLDGLVDTISACESSGIAIDTIGDNIFYDEHEGFGVIDYGLDYGDESRGQKIGAIGSKIILSLGVWPRKVHMPAHYDLLQDYGIAIENSSMAKEDKHGALQIVDTVLQEHKNKMDACL